MALRFEDPPAARRNRVDPLAADLTELKQHRNRWAVIATYPKHDNGAASGMAQAIRQGKTEACAPRGSFEAVTRTVGEELRVYVRYIGGEGVAGRGE